MIFKPTLRAKFIYLAIFLVVSFSLSLCLYLKTHFAQIMSDELLKRGASIARHVAEISTSAFIEHDYLQLESLAKDHQKAEFDIIYILMTNPNNEVVANSFTNGYPLDLKKVEHNLSSGEVCIRNIDFGGTPVYDIAAPVMDARIGSVRIGISAQPVNQAVDTLIKAIIGTTLVLGLVALIITLPLLQTVLRPISGLTAAVVGLTSGNREQLLPVSSNDEIGLLTNAFNQMVGTINSAEKRLAAQVEFLQVLIDDIPLPVFYKNSQGVMLGCNHSYVNFWGKPKQDIVGCHTDDINNHADAELHLRKDQELLEQKTPVNYEMRVVDAKGLKKQVVYNKALFNDEKGMPAGIIGVIQDVTEQRQADQMKNDFVSTVAHEFQTPLSIIIGFTELIQGDSLKPTEYREALNQINQKAEGLSEMVDELLDLAQMETGMGLRINLESCNVNEVLTELISSFRKRTTSHHFELELPAEDVTIFADKVRMAQVMENLLSNAVKYSAKQSSIKVVVTSFAKFCQVQVSDQGIGMTEQQKGLIFEKYYRADISNTAPAGTGLGMYITKSIIDAHNGQIEVDSVLEQGTTVTFRIPKITS